MKKIAKPIIQPIKCRGCIWGRWQETTQVCSRPVCVKDDGEVITNEKNSKLVHS